MLNPDYGVPSSGAHNQTSTADNTTVKTISLSSGTKAVYIAVTTNMAYFTFDGTTPSSTNGLPIVAGGIPWFISVGSPTIKWISSSTGGSLVNVLSLA